MRGDRAAAATLLQQFKIVCSRTALCWEPNEASAEIRARRTGGRRYN